MSDFASTVLQGPIVIFGAVIVSMVAASFFSKF